MASHDLRLNYQPQLVIAGFQPSTGVSLKIRITFFRFGPVVREAFLRSASLSQSLIWAVDRWRAKQNPQYTPEN